MRRRAWIPASAYLFSLPQLAFAGTGAYLVDDSSITPAGHCQVQSWLQVLSGGQQVLNTLPACSTGPIEWSTGVAEQSNPYQHQGSPAVKWMIVDGETSRLGVAVNAGVTWSNGHVTSKNTYGALTWTPDEDRRWSANVDVGEIFAPAIGWRPLIGEGIKYKAAEDLAVVAEYIRPWNGLSLTQAGIRWSFKKNDSLDLIAGRSDAAKHGRWATIGLNFAL